MSCNDFTDDGDDFRHPLKVRKYTSGSWANGRWIPGDRLDREYEIYASVQPTSGRDLQSLPEGRRQRSMYTLYTSAKLQDEDTEKQQNPDVVVLDDGEYEVTLAMRWRNNVINHYRYIVTRASEPTG